MTTAIATRPRLATDRWLLWLLLTLPLVWMTWQYGTKTVYYGEYLHRVLTAFDPTAGYLHFVVLAAMILARPRGVRRSR